MNDILVTLESSMGFSAKKARIYVALLELGEAVGADIAKKADLKRTTVYNILPELMKDGHVKVIVQNKKRLFSIEHPKTLKLKAEESVEAIASLLPRLNALQENITFKPTITLYEGAGGMRDIYEDFIESSKADDTIFAQAGTIDISRLVPDDFLLKYAERRFKKRIRLKVITSDSKLTRTLVQSAPQKLREVRIAKNFSYKGELVIYARKVAFISYSENFFGVVIESREIHNMHKAAFEELWERLA